MKLISLLFSKISSNIWLGVGVTFLLLANIYIDKIRYQKLNNELIQATTQLSIYKDRYSNLSNSYVELQREYSNSIKALDKAVKEKEELSIKINQAKKDISKSKEPIKESVRFIIKDINQ